MLRTFCEEINLIDDFELINSNYDFVDFLRSNFLFEYKEIFEDEKKALLANKNNQEEWDIRGYTFFLFQHELPYIYGLNPYYNDVDTLKIIIFYENILKPLKPLNEIQEIVKKTNREINDMKKLYNFYKKLQPIEPVCQIKEHIDAIKMLNLNFTQEMLDSDTNHVMHETIINTILKNYLIPFIPKYKSYLKRYNGQG
jgi:hypothetical protein